MSGLAAFPKLNLLDKMGFKADFGIKRHKSGI